jgi:hypothetical protein
MAAPTANAMTILRHDLPPADPTQIAVNTAVTVICGCITGELDREARGIGCPVGWVVRVDGLPDEGVGIAQNSHRRPAGAEALGCRRPAAFRRTGARLVAPYR